MMNIKISEMYFVKPILNMVWIVFLLYEVDSLN